MEEYRESVSKSLQRAVSHGASGKELAFATAQANSLMAIASELKELRRTIDGAGMGIANAMPMPPIYRPRPSERLYSWLIKKLWKIRPPLKAS